MEISDLKNVRNLKILKELIILEKYKELLGDYNFLLNPNTYKDSGKNLKYNIECLHEVFLKKNYGECIESLEAIINALNSRMFKVKCDKEWDNLLFTEIPKVRFCVDCSRNVFEVENEQDFNKRRYLEQCVFFNPRITSNTADGICVVESHYGDELGLPDFSVKEHKNDMMFPYIKK